MHQMEIGIRHGLNLLGSRFVSGMCGNIFHLRGPGVPATGPVVVSLTAINTAPIVYQSCTMA